MTNRYGYITTRQAAAIIDTTAAAIENMIEDGHLYATRIGAGHHWLIDPADVVSLRNAGRQRMLRTPPGTLADHPQRQ